jgi:hypothetical protein
VHLFFRKQNTLALYEERSLYGSMTTVNSNVSCVLRFVFRYVPTCSKVIVLPYDVISSCISTTFTSSIVSKSRTSIVLDL